MHWPKEIPEKLIMVLEREGQAFKRRLADVKQIQTLGHTEMRKDAFAIEKKASVLLDMTQKFRGRYFTDFTNESTKSKAVSHFHEWGMPADRELEAFFVGLDDYAVECAILGLITKMQIINKPKGRGGTKWPARHTVSNIAYWFDRFGLLVGKNDTFIQAVKNVFELAGCCQGDDAIEHYIKDMKKRNNRGSGASISP